ncbi:MAG: galactose-1-phosphate uridylyltransferase [Pirellulales bacterium]|nr:galactose-1-phosphate uridylyltransferase [Pirellulales bacterium]
MIAEDRAGRPNDFLVAADSAVAPASAPQVVSTCPFCVGNETHTPISDYVIRNQQGDWQVRVVPNKYPAVKCDPESIESEKQLFISQPALGAHEVVIESPKHLYDVIHLSNEDFATVLHVYRERLRHWERQDQIKHAIIFKNVGPAAGASLAHAHSQVIAFPYVSQFQAAELQAAHQYFTTHKRCIFCQLLHNEFEQGIRLVAEEGPFAAICAYAPRQPYETWILPTQHMAHFSQLSDAHLMSLANLLKQLLSSLHTQIPDLSYNLILHTAPFDRPGETAVDSYYHWHWELIPRTTRLAGLEWGTGVHVTPLAPERAARFLRENRVTT